MLQAQFSVFCQHEQAVPDVNHFLRAIPTLVNTKRGLNQWKMNITDLNMERKFVKCRRLTSRHNPQTKKVKSYFIKPV